MFCFKPVINSTAYFLENSLLKFIFCLFTKSRILQKEFFNLAKFSIFLNIKAPLLTSKKFDIDLQSTIKEK